MISTAIFSGICFASNSASGLFISNRNAADTAGSTITWSSAFSFFEDGESESSAAGRFLENSSPSVMMPFTWDVLRY